VARIAQETYARVRNLLTKRRDDLERIARRLLEKEVVEGEELRELLGTAPATSPA
jgi:ATP-dependent Zn protease